MTKWFFFNPNVINCEWLKGAWSHGMGLKMTRMHKSMQHAPMLVDKKKMFEHIMEQYTKNDINWIIYKMKKFKYVHI